MSTSTKSVEVRLVIQRFPQGPGQHSIGFRLLADNLPSDAYMAMVDLSSNKNGACMVPITSLWNHDSHSIGFNQMDETAYVNRVWNDVKTALSQCKGAITPTMLYLLVDIVRIKPLKKSVAKKIAAKGVKP